jgi:hypothetical protein
MGYLGSFQVWFWSTNNSIGKGQLPIYSTVYTIYIYNIYIYIIIYIWYTFHIFHCSVRFQAMLGPVFFDLVTFHTFFCFLLPRFLDQKPRCLLWCQSFLSPDSQRFALGLGLQRTWPAWLGRHQASISPWAGGDQPVIISSGMIAIQKTIRGLPSAKHTKHYGKSPSLIGKSTINGPFSIANC